MFTFLLCYILIGCFLYFVLEKYINVKKYNTTEILVFLVCILAWPIPIVSATIEIIFRR